MLESMALLSFIAVIAAVFLAAGIAYKILAGVAHYLLWRGEGDREKNADVSRRR